MSVKLKRTTYQKSGELTQKYEVVKRFLGMTFYIYYHTASRDGERLIIDGSSRYTSEDMEDVLELYRLRKPINYKGYIITPAILNDKVVQLVSYGSWRNNSDYLSFDHWFSTRAEAMDFLDRIVAQKKKVIKEEFLDNPIVE